MALLALAAGACGDDESSGPVFTITIQKPSGADPLEGIHTARIAVKQGEADTAIAEEAVGADGFDIRLDLTDQLTPTAVTVELEGDGVRRVGAPPPFVPAELFAAELIIPVGEPGTCGPIADASIGTPRVAPGLSRHGTFALVIGGVPAEGGSDEAGFLDLLDYGRGELGDVSRPMGRTRAIPYSTARSIILSEESEPFRYDIGSSDRPELAGGLHEGAGLDSGALALGREGAVVVGGGPEAMPVDDVTWVDAEGGTVRTDLSTGRWRPSLARVGSRVLVVGGNAEGAWAERIERSTGTGEALDAVPDGERTGGILLSDPSSERALLVGGVDAAGDPRTDTVLFDCSAGCTAAAGPSWDRARTGVTPVAFRIGGGLLLGGEGPVARVDQVIFDVDGVRIEPWGDLQGARADAAAMALPSGIVYVLGGAGPEGPRGDVEVCFPEEPRIAL